MGDFITYPTRDGMRQLPPPIDDSNLVDSLITWEGFLSEPKDIGDGKITLGSGLTNPKWHKLYRQRGNVWSEEDNRRAVTEEVAERRKKLESLVPHWNEIPSEAQKALISYYYNYPFNRENSPRMFDAFDRRDFREAIRQMDATSEDPKFKKGLELRREKERSWANRAYDRQEALESQQKPTFFSSLVDRIHSAIPHGAYGKWAEGGSLDNPWNGLSIAEKAEMMKVAIQNGITNLRDIKQAYNEFAEGGEIQESNKYPIGGYIDYPANNAIHNIGATVADEVKDEIRTRLYQNITPFGYHNPISRTSNAVFRNQPDDTRADENMRIRDSVPEAAALDAIWATYLNIPEAQRRKINPQYGISKTSGGYYRFNNPGMIFNFEQDLSPEGLYSLPNHKGIMMNGILGNYTVGLGRDNKGDYMFYSDSKLKSNGAPDTKTGWDINPYSRTVDNDTEETTEEHGQYGQSRKDLSYKIGKLLLGNKEDISMGIGTPVPIYDKIYLDDFYGIPQGDRGGYYLPELIVKGKTFGGGGNKPVTTGGAGYFPSMSDYTRKTIDKYGDITKAAAKAGAKYLADKITAQPDAERNAGLYFLKNLNQENQLEALDATLHSTRGGEVMSSSDAVQYGLPNYIRKLQGSPMNVNYTGSLSGRTSDGSPIPNKNRDLVNLYLKGDTTGFEDVTDNPLYTHGADYKKYTNEYYPGKKIRTYKMSSDGSPLFVADEELEDIKKNKLNKTSYVNESWTEGGDNVANILRWYKMIGDQLYAIDSDIWDFNPKDWKWEGDDNKMVDKVGTPFILKAIRPVLPESMKSYGGHIYDGTTEPTQQMNTFAPFLPIEGWQSNWLPEVIVTGDRSISEANRAVRRWEQNQPQLKPMTMSDRERVIAKEKGDANAEYARKQELQQKGVEALGVLGTFARPSTWAALPFTGIERFGEGFGTEWINTPFDLVSPFAWNKGTQLAKAGINKAANAWRYRGFNANNTPQGLLPEGSLVAAGTPLNTHLQGEDAIRMFKEYGGIPIPEGSINGEQLRKYVAEARERYGLVGNKNISDEEIAQSLYKHVQELGDGTAAVNAQGEPQLLFRGSTKRNTELHPKGTGEQTKAGEDNILGNLFLGELPGTRPGEGLERYLGTYREDPFFGARIVPPDTKAAAFTPKWAPEVKTNIPVDNYGYNVAEDNLQLLADSPSGRKVYKVPSEDMEFGANDINGFVVRTPKMRDATDEISVLQGINVIPEEKRLGTDLQSHYRNLVKQSEIEGQGLLKSEPAFEEINESGKFGRRGVFPKYRDEHDHFTYFALPNWNIRNAKHILPYDLRVPRNWNDPNVYKSILIPTIGAGTLGTLYGASNTEDNVRAFGGPLNANIYDGKNTRTQKMNRAPYIWEELPRLLREAGLDIRVSSGYRPAGKVGTAGNKSWHWRNGAVDIVPQGKTTFEDIENAIYSNPAIYNYMLANNFGMLDESGRSAESKATMRKTGATGPHFHFGKDSIPARRYAERMASVAKQPVVVQAPQPVQAPVQVVPPVPVQTQMPAFMPTNPQAFFTPFESYQRPVVIEEEPIQPLVEASNAYSEAALREEQRREKMNMLGKILSLTNQDRSNDGFINAINILTS